MSIYTLRLLLMCLKRRWKLWPGGTTEYLEGGVCLRGLRVRRRYDFFLTAPF